MKNNLWTLVKQRELKEGRTITQGELAAKFGVQRKTVSAWLNNEVDVFAGSILTQIAKYFECEVGDILYIDQSDDQTVGQSS